MGPADGPSCGLFSDWGETISSVGSGEAICVWLVGFGGLGGFDGFASLMFSSLRAVADLVCLEMVPLPVGGKDFPVIVLNSVILFCF